MKLIRLFKNAINFNEKHRMRLFQQASPLSHCVNLKEIVILRKFSFVKCAELCQAKQMLVPDGQTVLCASWLCEFHEVRLVF